MQRKKVSKFEYFKFNSYQRMSANHALKNNSLKKEISLECIKNTTLLVKRIL